MDVSSVWPGPAAAGPAQAPSGALNINDPTFENPQTKNLAMKLPDGPPLEELDLVLSTMQTPEEERLVQQALEGIPGIQAARIVPEGAWIRYEPGRVTKEQVCAVLNEAGFAPQFFQDSLSGETAEVSQE